MEKKSYLEFRKKYEVSKYKKPSLALHGLVDTLLIGLCYVTWTSQLPFILSWFSCTVLIAVVMFRNFSLMHESVHSLTHDNRNVNNVAGIWAGALCLQPFTAWKRVHLDHHYWTGNVEHDPSMSLLLVFPKLSRSAQWSISFLWKMWIPVVGFFQYVVFWYHTAIQIPKNLGNKEFVASFAFPVLLYPALVYFTGFEFLFQVLVPAVALYLLTIEVVGFPHHLELPHSMGPENVPVWDQNTVSRTCVYPKWFARWVVLNFNYHIEHHMFPDVPWNHLDTVYENLKAYKVAPYSEDLQFSWIIRNRLKGIDEVFKPQGDRFTEDQRKNQKKDDDKATETAA